MHVRGGKRRSERASVDGGLKLVEQYYRELSEPLVHVPLSELSQLKNTIEFKYKKADLSSVIEYKSPAEEAHAETRCMWWKETSSATGPAPVGLAAFSPPRHACRSIRCSFFYATRKLTRAHEVHCLFSLPYNAVLVVEALYPKATVDNQGEVYQEQRCPRAPQRLCPSWSAYALDLAAMFQVRVRLSLTSCKQSHSFT
jgi:hypothetical protein